MSWPNTLDLLVPVTTGQPISEAVETEQSVSLNAIEQTLGLNPQGSFATVAAALLALQTTRIVPPGAILQWGGATAPTGYVLCNGDLYSTTSPTYSALYAVIGTTYGHGSGTFAVPNLVGVGYLTGLTVVGANGYFPLATTSGGATVALLLMELPSHTHQLTGQLAYLTTGSASFENTTTSFESDLLTNPSTTDTVTSATAHNNLQPFTTVNFIIKL